MKNNTKLIMETWRRFLKEDILDDEPPEGYLDDKNNPEGFNPDDEDLDNPIDGEPPFDHAEPPEEDGIMADDDYDEVFKSPEYDELPYTEEDTMTPPDAFAERYNNDYEYDSEDYRPEDFEDSEF